MGSLDIFYQTRTLKRLKQRDKERFRSDIAIKRSGREIYAYPLITNEEI